MNYGSAHELISLVKKAAGTYDREHIYYFVGEVVSGSYDADTLTISVKSISDKNVKLSDESIKPESFGRDASDKEIGTNDKALINQSLDYLIYENISIMSGGCNDGFLIIPKDGSQVTVLISDSWQQGIVIQWSEIEIVQFVCNGSITTIDQTGLFVSTPEAKSTFALSNSSEHGAMMNVDEKTHYLQTDQSFDLKVDGGGEIKIGSKIKIKNAATDIKTVLTDTRSRISDTATVLTSLNAATAAAFASGSFPAAATSFAAATTAITTQITTLTTQLAALQVKIDSLFE